MCKFYWFKDQSNFAQNIHGHILKLGENNIHLEKQIRELGLLRNKVGSCKISILLLNTKKKEVSSPLVVLEMKERILKNHK